MVSREVITAALIGLAVTGVIPVIAGLVLLAVHKIKASSFWAGVLAYIIALVAYTIISGILSVVMVVSGGLDMTNMMNAASEPNGTFTVIATIILGIVLAIAMGICVGGCMKTRTFNAALSCGLGFGACYLVTAAINFYSFYATFSQINSGEFDKLYSTMVSQGFMDKATVNTLKEQFTSQTSGDMIISIVSPVAVALLMAAAAVIIMRGVCAKKAFAGIGISLVLFAAQFGLSGIIPNAAAAVIVTLAIGAAALIFAVRMKKDIVPPERPSYSNDSFMQSIESVKNDTDKE